MSVYLHDKVTAISKQTLRKQYYGLNDDFQTRSFTKGKKLAISLGTARPNRSIGSSERTTKRDTTIRATSQLQAIQSKLQLTTGTDKQNHLIERLFLTSLSKLLVSLLDAAFIP